LLIEEGVADLARTYTEAIPTIMLDRKG
jgi:hypothetical protein